MRTQPLMPISTGQLSSPTTLTFLMYLPIKVLTFQRFMEKSAAALGRT